MSILGRFGGGSWDFPGNSWSPFGSIWASIFDDFFVFFVASVFALIFYSFWEAFWWILGAFLEVILVTFPGFAKNAAPHELIINTNQIEGQAPFKTSQKASNNEEKNGMKTKTNK